MKSSILASILSLYVLQLTSVKAKPGSPTNENQNVEQYGPKIDFKAPSIHPGVSVPNFEGDQPGYHPKQGEDFRTERPQYRETRYQTVARNGASLQTLVQKFMEDLDVILKSTMRKITPQNATRSGNSLGHESPTGFEEEEELERKH